MSIYQEIEAKLAAHEIIIIDGGTGSEIQRRGVPMTDATWCAEANLHHPDVVRAVHRDYVDAGAEIIIANTFATSPLVFSHLSRLDELPAIDRAAVRLAREAAENRAAVAGSFSTMRPLTPGTDRTVLKVAWPKDVATDLFRRKAHGLAEAGVDLIAMEMMRDLDYSLWATEAAVETGLPVWVGISVEKSGSGRLAGFGREDYALEDIVVPLMQTGAKVLTLMHTSPNDTTEAIPVVKERWKGPLGCYPESGYFAMPDWQFVDIIPVSAFAELAAAWADQGVTILGGCCGIGPEHIRALATEIKARTTT